MSGKGPNSTNKKNPFARVKSLITGKERKRSKSPPVKSQRAQPQQRSLSPSTLARINKSAGGYLTSSLITAASPLKKPELSEEDAFLAEAFDMTDEEKGLDMLNKGLKPVPKTPEANLDALPEIPYSEKALQDAIAQINTKILDATHKFARDETEKAEKFADEIASIHTKEALFPLILKALKQKPNDLQMLYALKVAAGKIKEKDLAALGEKLPSLPNFPKLS